MRALTDYYKSMLDVMLLSVSVVAFKGGGVGIAETR
jgi:hypothetical protein